MTRADIPAVAEMISDPEVGRWLWFAPLPTEAVEAFFGPMLDQQETAVQAGEIPQAAVFLVETQAGEFLGQGAVLAVEESPGGFEIGFQLGRAAWGRGVGTRLGLFLCAYAVHKCDAYRIQAGCLAGNDASAGLLRKLGLALEGERPGYRLKAEQRHRELLFGVEVAQLDGAKLRAVAQEVGLL